MSGQRGPLVSRRFATLCSEEPFRIFFPLGLLLGAIGVLLWPLFLLGLTRTYPATSHARLMIEGMMSCFIFGFLGTEPRSLRNNTARSGAASARDGKEIGITFIEIVPQIVWVDLPLDLPVTADEAAIGDAIPLRDQVGGDEHGAAVVRFFAQDVL